MAGGGGGVVVPLPGGGPRAQRAPRVQGDPGRPPRQAPRSPPERVVIGPAAACPEPRALTARRCAGVHIAHSFAARHQAGRRACSGIARRRRPCTPAPRARGGRTCEAAAGPAGRESSPEPLPQARASLIACDRRWRSCTEPRVLRARSRAGARVVDSFAVSRQAGRRGRSAGWESSPGRGPEKIRPPPAPGGPGS